MVGYHYGGYCRGYGPSYYGYAPIDAWNPYNPTYPVYNPYYSYYPPVVAAPVAYYPTSYGYVPAAYNIPAAASKKKKKKKKNDTDNM